MADVASVGGKGGAAIGFMVAAGLVYEIIAAACSSPQTTELNASSRSKTLMKWVNIGIAQSALFVGAGAYIASQTGGNPRAMIYGGLLAALVMYACYYHARSAGLKNNQPGTESYS